MSTTFGILKPNPTFEDDIYIEIAYQYNGGGFVWKNELAEFLPDDMVIFAIDNDYKELTIKQIKDEINKNIKP